MNTNSHRIIFISLGFSIMGLIFSGMFFLSKTILFYAGWSIPDILIQLFNFLISILIYFPLMKFLFMIVHPGREKLFDSVLFVLEKIAGGDFKARVDSSIEKHGPFGSLAKSINSMADELARIEEMRQNFISNMSHEIQSPLTSIIGFTKVLQNDGLTADERQHYLSIIESESARISRLSDGLLKLAAFDAKTITFKPGKYRLDTQIRNCVLAMEPQWTAKNITIELELSEVLISADEDMLSQVWQNLLHNSIKFTPENGSILLNLTQSPDTFIFRITDTGIGIADEDQSKIFERFYKTDRSRSPSVKGNGLGLSIVREIIDLHSGTVDLESEIGRGTAITITLP